MTRCCEWCGSPLPEGAKPAKVTCSESHRALRWRWLNGVPRSGGRGPQEPPEGSPLLEAGPTVEEALDRVNAAARRAKRRKPSGLQVSYRKAVDALAAEFASYFAERPEDMREQVEHVLRGCLSDRQRARLDQRQEVDQ